MVFCDGFRHLLIRSIKDGLPKDQGRQVTRSQVELLERKLHAQLCEAWLNATETRAPEREEKRGCG